MLIGLLAMVVLPYAFIFMLFMIPELDNSGEKYVTVETYRQNEEQEQEQRLREKAMEEERERREKELEQEKYNRFYNKDTRTLTLPKTEFAGMEYAFAGTEAKAIRSAGVVSAIGVYMHHPVQYLRHRLHYVHNYMPGDSTDCNFVK